MSEALALYIALVGVLAAAITATAIAGAIRDRRERIANLHAALAAARAQLSEVVAMRDAAYDDLRTARISAIAACADRERMARDRDRAIRNYQSAANAVAAWENTHYNCDATIAGLANETDELRAMLHAACVDRDAVAKELKTAADTIAVLARASVRQDAEIKRWEKVAGNLTLADLTGMNRDK